MLKPNRGEPASPIPALIVLYSLMLAYGVTASIAGVTSWTAVSGPDWTLAWSLLVAVTSAGALVGVLLSARGKSHTIEVTLTLVLLTLLWLYGGVIFIHATVDDSISSLPSTFLPIALSVFPYSRLVDIARRSKTK
jgi:hypothetical protein